ncbi:MAG: hypothetical protein IKW28_07275 [Lachnospiraceae bacterium]|nr:hypothetical protein [Lachnospiraceae bacterium]
MKRFKTPRGAFFLLLAVGFVLLAYYLITLEAEKNKPEDMVVLTATQEILSRDLERNYPKTPKEVIRYYSDLVRCFYNEDCTEEELNQLGMKALELYDKELAANKDQDKYLGDLKREIADFKKNGYHISSYATGSSTDVFYFSEDGYDFARLYCTYYIRSGSYNQPLEEQYVLRIDENGHWKIYGWDEVKK